MGDIHIHMGPDTDTGSAPMPQSQQKPVPKKAAPKTGAAQAKAGKKPASGSGLKPTPKTGTNPVKPVGASGSGLKKPTGSVSASGGKPGASSSGGKSGSGASKSKPTLGMQKQQTPTSPTMGPLQGTSLGQSMPGAGMLPSSPTPQVTPQQKQAMKPPVPKVPGKEPKKPDDVAKARQQQSTVLSQRQARETKGQVKGAPREVNAGSGFWPPLSPLL